MPASKRPYEILPQPTVVIWPVEICKGSDVKADWSLFFTRVVSCSSIPPIIRDKQSKCRLICQQRMDINMNGHDIVYRGLLPNVDKIITKTYNTQVLNTNIIWSVIDIDKSIIQFTKNYSARAELSRYQNNVIWMLYCICWTRHFQRKLTLKALKTTMVVFNLFY